jgi:membrane-associated phospholipid phosphatase
MAYKWALGLLAAVAQSAVYFGIGYSIMPRSETLLATKLDSAIPFWPWTVWCYLPVYAGIFVTAIVGFKSRVLLHRTLLAVFGVIVVAAAGHMFVAAQYPRPTLPAVSDDLSLAFIAHLHRLDPPGNVFPSLHVAQTSLLAFTLYRDRPKLGAAAIVAGALLALSTLTTKQHFVVDVLAGYFLAFVGRALVLRGLPRERAGLALPERP